MQAVVFLCVVVVGCFAMPFEETAQKSAVSTTILKAVADTTNTAHKRSKLSRRSSSGTDLAFSWIDTNDDDHITADEFAAFYSQLMPSLTSDQWKFAFRATLPRVDTNGNGELEIGEFETLARIGGYSG